MSCVACHVLQFVSRMKSIIQARDRLTPTPVIPALERLRQEEDHLEFEASLIYGGEFIK